MDDEKAKSLKKLLVIKEICSWLPFGLDGQKVCSQEHISLITSSFHDCAFIIQFQHKGYLNSWLFLYLYFLRLAILHVRNLEENV